MHYKIPSDSVSNIMWRWHKFLIAFCFCVAVTNSNSTSCTTPNGEKAECVSLFSCENLKDALASGDASVRKFIEASGCGDGHFMVCCGRLANYTQIRKRPGSGINNNVTKEARKEYVIKKLIPSKRYCGLQHTDDYFYNETVTALDEFPWVVYIPLEPTQEGLESKCVGVLINNRYVLTISDCAAQYLDKVILGQYHKNESVSCIKTSFGVNDCAESTVVEVESKMGLPDSKIMLLRLSEKVTYTDYIRPICLPLLEADRLQPNEKVFSSGWGEENTQGKFMTIKKRLEHRVVNNDNCGASDIPFICTNTSKSSKYYVCGDDDGGPLMYKHTTNWFTAGVISVSENGCFDNNRPFKTIPITEKVLDFLYEHMRH